MPFKSHTFACAVCNRPTSLDSRLGPELLTEILREQFAVMSLVKVAAIPDPENPMLFEFRHPLVCSDGCHGRANREGIPGWSVLDGNEARTDGVVYMPGVVNGEGSEP